MRTDKIKFLDSGENVVVKYDSDGFFGAQALAIISHEHRLLKFIGEHKNIVRTIGLVHLSDSFAHVLNFEPGLNLAQSMKYSLTSLREFKDLVRGLIDGLNFLFEKGVLHNHLVPENVILNGNCPIIIGFTFACRAESAKLNINDVIKKFADQHYFAPELYKGSRVSYSSDVFSFGKLLKTILKRRMTFDMDDALETRLVVLAEHCLKRNPRERPAHKFLSSRINRMIDVS